MTTQPHTRFQVPALKPRISLRCGVYIYDDPATYVIDEVPIRPTVTDTYEYDAFGNLLNKTGSTPNNYLYRGEQFDSDLGLYYLRARYYNPLTGRFMSRDPDDGEFTDPATLHKYLYADGDPVNLVDPTGQEAALERLLTSQPARLVTRAAVAGAGGALAGGSLLGVTGVIVCSLHADTATIAAVARNIGYVQAVVYVFSGCTGNSTVPGTGPTSEPTTEPGPNFEPPPPPLECVSAKRGLNGNNPGALRYDADGLSTFEVLQKPYACVINFEVCFKPPKSPGVVGQIISVGNDNGTFSQGVIGVGTFTPELGDSTIGNNHWSLSQTIPDSRTLLKQLCPNSRFKNN